jgi:hypothetical protein
MHGDSLILTVEVATIEFSYAFAEVFHFTSITLDL